MNTSDSTAEINKALAAFQGDVEAVKKGADNPFFSSKYADLPSIIAVIKPHLAEHGLAVVQGGQQITPESLAIITRITHESGEWIETVCPIGVAKQDPQGYGSAYTYGRRYSLQAALGLSAEDDDGNAASEPTPQPTRDAPPQPREQPPTHPQASPDKCAARFNTIKTAAMRLAMDDEPKALDILGEWSAFTSRDGNTMRIDSWDYLQKQCDKDSKWSFKVERKAKESIEKMPDPEPHAEGLQATSKVIESTDRLIDTEDSLPF